MFIWILIATSFTAFLTSCAIGANDVANSFATSVGAKVLTLRQAIIIASIFEFGGALLMGSHVTDTLRKGIVSSDLFKNDIYVLMYGMLCASISTGIWLAIATYYKSPVSTTHSVVGSIIGFALVFGGVDAVKWEKVGLIVLSWVISPLLSGVLTLCIFSIIKYGALKRNNPIKKTLIIFPFMVFLTMAINTFFIIYKGTPGLGLKDTELWIGLVSATGVGLVSALMTIILTKCYLEKKIDSWTVVADVPESTTTELSNNQVIHSLPQMESKEFVEISVSLQEIPDSNEEENNNDGTKRLQCQEYDPKAEKLFSYLQIFTACLSAFAHGANDVANSIGPYAAVVGIYFNMTVESKSNVPIWVLAIGGSGIVVGLALWGKRVIERMGQELVKITASRGFSMELGASLSVVVASRLGIPVSTTRCQVGSIIGGGLADGRKNVDWLTFLKIILGWLVTLPVTAGCTALLFSFGFFAPK